MQSSRCATSFCCIVYYWLSVTKVCHLITLFDRRCTDPRDNNILLLSKLREKYWFKGPIRTIDITESKATASTQLMKGKGCRRVSMKPCEISQKPSLSSNSYVQDMV